MAQTTGRSVGTKSSESDVVAGTEGVTPAPQGADESVESMPVYKGGTDGGGAPAPEGMSSNVASVGVAEAKQIDDRNQELALEEAARLADLRKTELEDQKKARTAKR